MIIYKLILELGIQFSMSFIKNIYIYHIKSQDHGDCYFLYIYSVNDVSCASGEMGNRTLFISEWP